MADERPAKASDVLWKVIRHPETEALSDLAYGILQEEIEAIIAERDRLKSYHRPDCNALLDDESDYVHLADAGECTCPAWAQEVADMRKQRDRLAARVAALETVIREYHAPGGAECPLPISPCAFCSIIDLEPTP
jgi:hypothetical protein